MVRTFTTGFFPVQSDGLARDKTLWRAVKGIDDETLALRLLVACISVCDSDKLGADRDGEKNYRDIALWIGRNLASWRPFQLAGGTIGRRSGRTLAICTCRIATVDFLSRFCGCIS